MISSLKVSKPLVLILGLLASSAGLLALRAEARSSSSVSLHDQILAFQQQSPDGAKLLAAAVKLSGAASLDEWISTVQFIPSNDQVVMEANRPPVQLRPEHGAVEHDGSQGLQVRIEKRTYAEARDYGSNPEKYRKLDEDRRREFEASLDVHGASRPADLGVVGVRSFPGWRELYWETGLRRWVFIRAGLKQSVFNSYFLHELVHYTRRASLLWLSSVTSDELADRERFDLSFFLRPGEDVEAYTRQCSNPNPTGICGRFRGKSRDQMAEILVRQLKAQFDDNLALAISGSYAVRFRRSEELKHLIDKVSLETDAGVLDSQGNPASIEDVETARDVVRAVNGELDSEGKEMPKLDGLWKTRYQFPGKIATIVNQEIRGSFGSGEALTEGPSEETLLFATDSSAEGSEKELKTVGFSSPRTACKVFSYMMGLIDYERKDDQDHVYAHLKQIFEDPAQSTVPTWPQVTQNTNGDEVRWHIISPVYWDPGSQTADLKDSDRVPAPSELAVPVLAKGKPPAVQRSENAIVECDSSILLRTRSYVLHLFTDTADGARKAELETSVDENILKTKVFDSSSEASIADGPKGGLHYSHPIFGSPGEKRHVVVLGLVPLNRDAKKLKKNYEVTCRAMVAPLADLLLCRAERPKIMDAAPASDFFILSDGKHSGAETKISFGD